MKAFSRTDRIGTELRRELAQLLRDQVRDPRLANITVHEVRVTRDLAHAKVFFTCFGNDDAEQSAKTQERLLNGRLAGFLRHALAQTVQLRTIPQLHFVFDESIGYGERLSTLIDQAVANPIQQGSKPTEEQQL
ncbi:ribosome-binding factor A [Chromatium okenii]|uniref:30S ribosome-binding factor RbfA n=1 Tax=Chromatium okenii TaxID=61644 RepID=UPI0019072383|nr:ribosome-binding factor A [Chromatium okenii]